MRIDSRSIVAAEKKAVFSNLMRNLDSGDVVKAKVLEISSREAVLRLSDGTVMKAKTGVTLDIKPGQNILLAVRSKTENSLVLETVKDSTRITETNDSKLSAILDTLDLKPDNLNLKLAAEFLKNDIKPDVDNMTSARELFIGSDNLDAEKAVFIISKGVDSDHVADPLVRLLDGSLKLGKLLESLYDALNDTSDKVLDIDDSTYQEGTPTHSDTENSRTAGNTSDLGSTVDSGSTAKRSAISTSIGKNSVQEPSTQKAAVNTTKSTATLTGDLENMFLSETIEAAASASDKTSSPQPTKFTSSYNTGADQLKTGSEKTAEFPPAISDKATVGIGNKASRIFTHASIDVDMDSKNPQETAKKIMESIKKLYVNIDKKLSSTRLDPAEIKDRLSDLIDKINSYIRIANNTTTIKEDVASAASLLEDTSKHLDIMNSSQISYYQIPININGHRSTAELYVMKRQQSRKRIDPHDSVLFLSLDTKNMGRIETILNVRGSGISISLRSGSRKINDFVKANIKTLYNVLAECGYKLTDIRYYIIGSAATPIQQDKILSDIIRYRHEKVDLRI